MAHFKVSKAHFSIQAGAFERKEVSRFKTLTNICLCLQYQIPIETRLKLQFSFRGAKLLIETRLRR